MEAKYAATDNEEIVMAYGIRTAKKSGIIGVVLLLIMSAAGCEFENPQSISADDLNDPQLASQIADGAAATFADAYSHTTLISSLAADAVIWTGSETGNRLIDRGVWLRSNNEIQIAYDNLVRARWTGDNAVSKLQELLSDASSSTNLARSYLFTGFSFVLLGDYFEQFTFDGGNALSREEAYSRAINRLEQAAQTAGNADASNLQAAAIGGQARAHHALYTVTGGQGELSAAAADAERALSTASEFRYEVAYGRPARVNLWWGEMQDSPELGLAMHIVRLDDPVSGGHDPRVPVSDFQGFSSNGQDSLFFQEKYPTAETDMPLVKWQEMHLILAEEEWRNEQLSEAESHINAVRRAAGLSDFNADNSTDVRDQLIHERLATLAFEGRRWMDARRFSEEFDDVSILPDERWSPEVSDQSATRLWPIPNSECEANENLSC